MFRPLDRRTFLKGLGSTAIALPALEAMLDSNGKAYAADGSPVPKRLWVSYGGYSLGTWYDQRPNFFVPDNAGFGYDLKLALRPFASYGNVQSEISLVTGLMVPWAGQNGDVVPPGGRPDNFHGFSMFPQLCGTRTSIPEASFPSSETVDQVALRTLDANRQSSERRGSLHYCVQARPYYAGATSDPVGGCMSYRQGSSGLDPMVPIVSPRAAFMSLTTGLTPSDPTAATQAARVLSKRKSVLDYVRRENEQLVHRLSGSDRIRLERHLEEIRALELKVNAIPPLQVGACSAPPDPGADPAINDSPGGYREDNPYYNDPALTSYSGEDQRASVFCGLIRMAMACDIARAGTLMFSHQKSYLSLYPLLKDQGCRPLDLHGYTHGPDGFGDSEELAKAIAWHTGHYARLVSLLRDTPEGDGNLLDSCVLIHCSEGGHGIESEDPVNTMTRPGSHSTQNMAVLVAGRAGGLKPGQHIRATDKHPAQVMLSGLRAVGGPSNRLGEVSGIVPELFTA